MSEARELGPYGMPLDRRGARQRELVAHEISSYAEGR